MSNKGKLIVIDGPDGCGKATQTDMLLQRLLVEGFVAEKIDFPRYDHNYLGALIGKFQCDEALQFSKQNPYLCSLPYAIDRFESKPWIEGHLQNGTHIISDRYVSANQLHQGGKIEDLEKRKEFLDMLDHLEYEIFKIPRPTMVVYLDLPLELSVAFMKQKLAGEKKQYSKGELDLVEQDMIYQLGARSSGTEMIRDPAWVTITCSLDGETSRTKEDIHEEIFGLVHQIL